MASEYVIGVYHRDSGQVVTWAPGLTIEHEFIGNLRKRVEAKSVGVGRTTAMVGQAVVEALTEMLMDLKGQV